MRGRGGLLMLGAALLAVGAARGGTTSGTLITNMASSTYFQSEYGLAPLFSVSYSPSAYVLVAGPDVQLQKIGTPTIACSGGTVTFCVWAANVSAYTSAFNVILEDKFPVGFSYINGQTLWPAASITKGYMTTAGVCPPSCVDTWGVEPPTGQTAIGGGLWLKWVVNQLGPSASAMMCFRMTLL